MKNSSNEDEVQVTLISQLILRSIFHASRNKGILSKQGPEFSESFLLPSITKSNVETDVTEDQFLFGGLTTQKLLIQPKKF